MSNAINLAIPVSLDFNEKDYQRFLCTLQERALKHYHSCPAEEIPEKIKEFKELLKLKKQEAEEYPFLPHKSYGVTIHSRAQGYTFYFETKEMLLNDSYKTIFKDVTGPKNNFIQIRCSFLRGYTEDRLEFLKLVYSVLRLPFAGENYDAITDKDPKPYEYDYRAFWSFTILDKKLVSKLGRERVLNAPCDIIEELDDGAVLMLIDKDRFSSFYEKRKRLRQFLRSEYVEGYNIIFRYFVNKDFGVQNFIDLIAELMKSMYPTTSIISIVSVKREILEREGFYRFDKKDYDKLGFVEASSRQYGFKLYNPKSARWKGISVPVFEISMMIIYDHLKTKGTELLRPIKLLQKQKGWSGRGSSEADYFNDFDAYFRCFEREAVWSVNLFSKEEVKKYGKAYLLNAPCEQREELEDGAILMLINKDSFSSLYEQRKRLREYLQKGKSTN